MPIRPCAASIPPTLLSNASLVRSTKELEFVTESEKFWVAVFRAEARESRESVSAFCSVEWWFRRVSEVVVVVVLVLGFGAKGCAVGLVFMGRERERDVEDVVAVFSRIEVKE